MKLIKRIWNRMTDCDEAASGLVVISSIAIAVVTLSVGVVV